MTIQANDKQHSSAIGSHTYSAPRLSELGLVRDLTAGGSGSMAEGGNGMDPTQQMA